MEEQKPRNARLEIVVGSPVGPLDVGDGIRPVTCASWCDRPG
jgi:hypothetical protein